MKKILTYVGFIEIEIFNFIRYVINIIQLQEGNMLVYVMVTVTMVTMVTMITQICKHIPPFSHFSFKNSAPESPVNTLPHSVNQHRCLCTVCVTVTSVCFVGSVTSVCFMGSIACVCFVGTITTTLCITITSNLQLVGTITSCVTPSLFLHADAPPAWVPLGV